MSGDIEDLPIRVCPACATVYMADDRIYEDVDRCPRCGADVVAAADGRLEKGDE